MTTQEINEKVQSMKAKGCKLSDAAITAIFMKSEKNSVKNLKRSAAIRMMRMM